MLMEGLKGKPQVRGSSALRVSCEAIYGTSMERRQEGEVRPGSILSILPCPMDSAVRARVDPVELHTVVPTLPIAGFLPVTLSSPVTGTERGLR